MANVIARCSSSATPSDHTASKLVAEVSSGGCDGGSQSAGVGAEHGGGAAARGVGPEEDSSLAVATVARQRVDEGAHRQPQLGPRARGVPLVEQAGERRHRMPRLIHACRGVMSVWRATPARKRSSTSSAAATASARWRVAAVGSRSARLRLRCRPPPPIPSPPSRSLPPSPRLLVASPPPHSVLAPSRSPRIIRTVPSAPCAAAVELVTPKRSPRSSASRLYCSASGRSPAASRSSRRARAAGSGGDRRCERPPAASRRSGRRDRRGAGGRRGG